MASSAIDVMRSLLILTLGVTVLYVIMAGATLSATDTPPAMASDSVTASNSQSSPPPSPPQQSTAEEPPRLPPNLLHASWWTDLDQPEAFKLARLELVYPKGYFVESDAHPYQAVRTIVKDVKTVYAQLTGRRIRSIAEFGAAHGFFTNEFAAAKLDYRAVEGSPGGVAGLLRQPNVAASRVHQADLRLPVTLPPPRAPNNRSEPLKYDLAMCTEVGEHIELPFHGTLVRTLTAHADVVLFSFCVPRNCPKGALPSPQCEPESNVMLIHPAEMPLRYWVNLFDFFGYGAVLIQFAEHPDSNEGFIPRFLAYRRDSDVLRPAFLRKAKRYRLRGAQADSLIHPNPKPGW